MPLPASCASPAIFASWSVTPSIASNINMQTSARSTANKLLITLYFSIFSFTLLFFLIPAVSINTYFPNSFSNSESVASLVVPAMSLTITLFSPNILFTNEDLPTFGLPIIATFIVNSSSFSVISFGNLS